MPENAAGAAEHVHADHGAGAPEHAGAAEHAMPVNPRIPKPPPAMPEHGEEKLDMENANASSDLDWLLDTRVVDAKVSFTRALYKLDIFSRHQAEVEAIFLRLISWEDMRGLFIHAADQLGAIPCCRACQ